ncbi:MAG: Gfo/Idh/MocA family protein [Phycisphaeraceae bacterium]
MKAHTKLGLVGLGGISAAHRAAAEAEPAVGFIAGVDPNPAGREAFAKATNAATFESVASMLADDAVCEQLDGVVLCTPPAVRAELVGPLLERGIGVLMEKPAAHSLEHAQRLVDLAEQTPGVPARVAYCHRFTPAVVEMKRQIDAGELGELVRFENTFACWHPTMREHWMSDPALSGGGSLIDTGSHGLDLFHYLCGPSRLEGMVRRHGWSGRGDSNATLLVAAGSADAAIAGVLNSGWAEPARFTLTVVGSKGLLGYDYEKPTELISKPSEGESKTLAIETHEVRFARQLKAFADLLARPDRPSQLCTFAQAAAVAEVLAGQSALAG